MMSMLMLSLFLKHCGFSADVQRVKLVRHRDARYDIDHLRAVGWFDAYQGFQSRPIFDGCEQLLVFIGEDANAARFIGVYDVGERHPGSAQYLPAGCPHRNWSGDGRVYYELSKSTGYEDLEDRLLIDWGKGALAWHQWFRDRPVLELRPRGRALPPFRDYLRVNLRHRDLVTLASHPDAHRDWVAGLKAVGAIYLIVNSDTGEQYVGSATGEGGLWQRWRDYAATGHGGNVRLEEACLKGRGAEAFTFSILETFSKTLTVAEALDLEAFFKQKLGTRAFGLNAN